MVSTICVVCLKEKLEGSLSIEASTYVGVACDFAELLLHVLHTYM